MNNRLFWHVVRNTAAGTSIIDRLPPVVEIHLRTKLETYFHILPLKSVIPNFVACLVFFGMAFSFIKLISSSDTLTKREAAILKICPPAIITSAEVIIAEYDTILGQ